MSRHRRIVYEFSSLHHSLSHVLQEVNHEGHVQLFEESILLKVNSKGLAKHLEVKVNYQ